MIDPTHARITLRDFEIRAIRLLVGQALSSDLLSRIIEELELVDLTFSGHGYHLVCRHQDLPTTRKVFDTPLVTAVIDETRIGFVVFVENGELTIDCHNLSGSKFPGDLRSRKVAIETG